MNQEVGIAKAQRYLKTLCEVKPNRRTGSCGNRTATDFFAETLRLLGYQVDATPFDCLDYECGGANLIRGDESFQVYVSPYSLGGDVLSELIAVSTLEQLKAVDCERKILLMHGPLCSEQLMPKNFVFYNPEHHQKIIALLESRKPAAIVAATGQNPDQVGALYPFPLIADGDFDIPSVYCRDSLGNLLAAREGDAFRLQIDARRLPSHATNVVARLNPDADRRIVITAHIDAYEDSPGAVDDGSGIVVLLLCAEMLSNYRGANCVEILALNGEDHYSAGGEMDYLKRYGDEFESIRFAVNVDDIGYERGSSAYSFYEFPPPLENHARELLRRCDGFIAGERWSNGDYMVFVQNGVPALAFTSECMLEFMHTRAHTRSDTPEIVDYGKLVQVANAIGALMRSL